MTDFCKSKDSNLKSFSMGSYLFAFEKASDSKWEYFGRTFKNFETRKWPNPSLGGGSFFFNGWCISLMYLKGEGNV